MGIAPATDPGALTARAGLSVGAWVVLAVAGWAAGSVALTALAPLALLGVPLAILLDQRASGRVDPLEPLWIIVALFAFTYLLVPGLAALRPDDFGSLPGYLDSPPAQWQTATWVSGLAFLALLHGYFGPGGGWIARLLPEAPRTPPTSVVGATAAGLFGLGLLAAVAIVLLSGGADLSLSALLDGRLRDESVESFSGRGYLSVGYGMLALAPPCAALWAARRGGRRAWLAVAGSGAVGVVLLGAVLDSRMQALVLVVGVLAVVHYRVRAFSVREALALGAGLLVLVLAFTAIRRPDASRDTFGLLGRLVGTFDGFHFLVNALARVDDFLLGGSVAEDTVLTYLPRSLWPGKPEVYGILRTQEAVVPGLHAAVAGGSTYPPGIVAEGYVNFGMLGALIFPWSAGALLSGFYTRLRAGRGDFYLLMIGWLLADSVGIMRGLGPVLPAIAVTMVLLSPLLVGGAIGRTRPAASRRDRSRRRDLTPAARVRT